MLGAIIGDIVGSVYEWANIKTKVFALFSDGCKFTDDTVMTVATAEAILNGGSNDDFIDAYKKWGRLYPHAGYGSHFKGWLRSNDREPYNSYGNGSAMRASPCGWVLECSAAAPTEMWPPKGWELAARSAAVTHNHPEGIKGAQATAEAIFLARCYASGYYFDCDKPWTLDELKQKIKERMVTGYGYDMSLTLDEIRPTYTFDVSCQGTVPAAVTAFLESTDFEDAIRNAISLGGDSDTLAAITGSIAEAAYGIPRWLEDMALSYLDEPLRDVIFRWRTVYGGNPIYSAD